MYDYRKMTQKERRRILAQRQKRRFPWHAPPHFEDGAKRYLITAACFQHGCILSSPYRLTEFRDALFEGLDSLSGIQTEAWVIQPNHYHILVRADLEVLGPWLGRLHNGKATQWNREDSTPKRKVWFRFSDRMIRSDRHFYATVNYIHANPVKHGYVEKATDWPWSSLHGYLDAYGRDTLATWWRQYPVEDYGKGWDDWHLR